MNKLLVIGLGVALVALNCSAKTVALWPIEYDQDVGEYNLHCATNPDYDLTALKTVTPKTGTDTLDWNLPPNPDTSKFLFTPYNRYSLYTTADGYLKAENVGAMMTVDKPHTLEGFIKFTDVGGHGGGTWVIISSVAPFANGQIDFRMVPKEGKYYLHFAVFNPIKIDRDFAGPGKTADELKDGEWHHWAYTYQPDNGSGQRVVEAFWDGVSVGTISDSAVTTKWTNNGELMLGSRGQYGNTVKGAIEYVRLSDTVLTPEEFLNYGESGTVITTTKSPTVGYWRFGADANGKADLSSMFGNAGFYLKTMANYYSGTTPQVTVEQGKTSLYAVDEGAFTGQPANSTVTLSGGNQGAFYSNGDSNGGMNFNGLGTCLDFSKDWTVEMYFRPDTCDTSVTGSRSLFGTMQGTGWVLMTCANPKTSANWARRFRLSATDATNHTEYSHMEILPMMEEWRSEWKHIALVHRAQDEETGFGSWQLYVDGELHATLKDKQAMNDVSPGRFSIGTTHNLSGGVWIGGAPGYYDCVRVSATALSPEQFICTKDGTAATDVQAFFPLDKSADGTACSYFKDVVGSYTVGQAPSAKPGANSTDAPTVTNPDGSEKLRSSSATGSVDFKSGGGGSAVFCCDEATLSAFNNTTGDRSVTIEAFVKHNSGSTGDEQIFVGSTSPLSEYWPAMEMRISYRFANDENRGFILSDTKFTAGQFQDIKTRVTMSDGEWHHVAFVATHDETTAYWKLYLDGEEKYTNSAALKSTGRGFATISVGGRYWGGDYFNGCISNLRISKGALSPSQFLNAAAPTPEAPETIAYWPLDYVDGQMDMANKITHGYDFIGTATGDRDRAYSTNYHASVAAETERNRGSVTVAGDSRIVSQSVAADNLGLASSFTLEGCIKSAASVGEESVVCGTYHNGLGWKMIYDATGATPRLKMFGCGKVPTGVFVDDTFDWDASTLTDGWHQIALAYDSSAGSGTWTLLVDAVQVATVANSWNPKNVGLSLMDLTLGAWEGSGETSFAASYDVWRLSKGVRSADQLLYNPLWKTGFLLLLM